MQPSRLNNEDFDMQEMKIKYGGGNEIEANTYINSLLHFTNIVQEVNKGMGKERKVEVKIKANTGGSFIVDLIIESTKIIEGIKQIFSMEHVTYGAGLVYLVGEAYKVAKHLKGKKPKEITNDKDITVRIENNYGEVQVFDFRGANIYLKNSTIQEAIAQEFETLEEDANVTSLEFLDKNEKPFVEIQREEFFNLSSSGSTVDLSNNERIEIVPATLYISSLDLELKKKWDFYYQGHKINAKVEDGAFGEKIDKGERFGKGDTFEVTMEIRQQYDASVNTYINKAYTVTKILYHIERPAQGSLEFPKQEE